MDLDDAVRRAQGGDVRAFEALYEDVHPRLLRFLTARLGGTEDAADVASETWLQVTRDLHRFRGDADAFRGWVVSIGRHRALDAVRAAGRRPSDPWDPLQLPERVGGDASDEAEQSLATQRALALIASLPPDQAEAVLLRVVVGLDAPTAAKALGKRPGAVRMATSRGLAALERALRDAGHTGAGVTPGGSAAL
jgi:RNA polymerase sigma-70 factor, ECF subfamily